MKCWLGQSILLSINTWYWHFISATRKNIRSTVPLIYYFYSIFNWAISKGLKIYDFGTFTVDEEPNMGLGRFKENFGASGVFRDTVELNLT